MTPLLKFLFPPLISVIILWKLFCMKFYLQLTSLNGDLTFFEFTFHISPFIKVFIVDQNVKIWEIESSIYLIKVFLVFVSKGYVESSLYEVLLLTCLIIVIFMLQAYVSNNQISFFMKVLLQLIPISLKNWGMKSKIFLSWTIFVYFSPIYLR